MRGESFYFHSIKVEGYRGRNFELNMKPLGKPSVFIMDNDTGKTTLIELLRWCFKFRESDAIGNFSHMWDKTTHVLDFEQTGYQECKISINFSDGKNNYLFTRVTSGEHYKEEKTIRESQKKYLLVRDKIKKIDDVLNINNGEEFKKGDDVFHYLNSNFRLAHCADYFCFDGEKARDVMENAASKRTIDNLIEIVNQRAAHPQIEKYKNMLFDLQDKVLKAGKSSVGGTVTELAIQKRINKIDSLSDERDEKEIEIAHKNDELRAFEVQLDNLEKELTDINEQIGKAKSQNLIELNGLKEDLRRTEKDIEKSRSELYENMVHWPEIGLNGNVMRTKITVRESGKLPEPYHDDLISSCLSHNPPTCIICGRTLNPESKEHVERLAATIASDKVHKFLIGDFTHSSSVFDVKRANDTVKNLVSYKASIEKQIGNLNLDDDDQKLVDRRDEILLKLSEFNRTVGNLSAEIKALEEDKARISSNIDEETENIETLKKYELIIKKIKETNLTLEKTERKMKDKTISIISDVMSQSVKSILGNEYEAVLSKDLGLMLSKRNSIGSDIGGMASRLILSYCFAESMSTIDPIIVDTPSGNIGEEYRKKLAKHLAANHNQVILLCIDDEITNFADQLTNDFTPITNNDYCYE